MAAVGNKKEVAVAKLVAGRKPAAAKELVVKAAGSTRAKKPEAAAKVVAERIVPVKAEAPEKARKTKLVRDSFTMPEDEYAVLGQVKKACLKAGIEVKKSQLLRIGLVLLSRSGTPELKKLIAELAPLKAGRPKKEK
ncbi:hypothetical protein H8K47_04465 [Undibacterium sp. CY7W]|uniref:Uncharacterized protein n=1 Tax=Undibacterium rugosum TaxID=2762291 RepID=A0A923HYP3_9BURK|nr:hypothetical protein [Undibacterium rugosum]MBC3934604.1 hypothetical protein [Undibacterium rugosum]